MVRHTVYTIKQASARTGLGAPLIRAWERRYGVVRPIRTPAGYRLYDEEAIRILLAMRGLLDTGWTASEAARAIGAGEIAVDAMTQAGSVEVQPAAAAANRNRLIDRFVSAAEATSAPDTEAAIDEILAAGSFEAMASSPPLCRRATTASASVRDPYSPTDTRPRSGSSTLREAARCRSSGGGGSSRRPGARPRGRRRPRRDRWP